MCVDLSCLWYEAVTYKKSLCVLLKYYLFLLKLQLNHIVLCKLTLIVVESSVSDKETSRFSSGKASQLLWPKWICAQDR